LSKDIKIGIGLAVIFILILTGFLLTTRQDQEEGEVVDTQADLEVRLSGRDVTSEEAEPSLFGPSETAEETTSPLDELYEETALGGTGGVVEEAAPEVLTPTVTEEAAFPGPELPPAVSVPRKYTVKAGDNLWKIAEEVYGDSGKWKLIQKANDIKNTEALKIGRVLIIPEEPSGTVRVEKKAPSSAPSTAGERTHTVKKGETLWIIAQEYYGDGSKWKLIQKANDIKNPDKLDIGQTLKIPPAR